MRSLRQVALASVVGAVLLAGCAPSAPVVGGGDGGGEKPAAPKRIVAAIQGDPHTLYQDLNPASRVRGIDALEQLVAAGLTRGDQQGNPLPQLAEAVPTIENGLWKLFPDGRMETTWRIRDGARWHDETAFTSDDLVFTMTVVRDRELPIFGNFAYELIDEVLATDPRTVVVRWKQPFIEADILFS